MITGLQRTKNESIKQRNFIPMSVNNPNAEMSFLEHLEELRWHLIRALASIFVFGLIAFILKDLIFNTLILSLKTKEFWTYQAICKFSKAIGFDGVFCNGPTQFEIVNIDMAGQFLTHLKVSVVLGFIFSFPYIVWEVWRFIKPGLHDNEKQYTRGIVLSASLLFFLGVTFGYFILAPLSINFFANYTVSKNVVNTIQLGSYISILSTLVMASGIMFELPIAVYILSKVGLLTPENMREYRKHALIVILIIAAVITPADVWTQLFVSIPVYGLYEISIYISKWVHGKKPSINS